MTTLTLAFMLIQRHSDDIVEVIVNEGVEMDQAKFAQYRQALQDMFGDQLYGVLINKRNAYTYSFDVQQQLSTTGAIETAVVVYSQAAVHSINAMRTLPGNQTWEAKVFVQDREAALTWLDQAMQKHRH